MSDAVGKELGNLSGLMFSIAYRMLSSVSDAEDIVPEAAARYLRARADGVRIDSPKAYLSAVVTRLAIDQLRSARVRREQYVGQWLPEPLLTADGQLISIFALEVAHGRVRAVRAVINPDKLHHLGPVADVWALLGKRG